MIASHDLGAHSKWVLFNQAMAMTIVVNYNDDDNDEKSNQHQAKAAEWLKE